MRFIRFLVFLPILFFISNPYSFGQQTKWVKQPRILILLDGSSSMVETWTGKKQRYKAAQDIILSLMDSIYMVNANVEFGLRVFGHQHSVTEKNCFDTRNEVPFTKSNYVQMALRLNDIKPYGITPIAYSIKQAAEVDMVNEDKYVYSIILITDGGESCGGDICDVVKTLLEKKIYFKPYIISMVDFAPLRDAYDCMGNYMQVTKDADIVKTVSAITEAYRPMLKLSGGDMNQLKTLAASSPSVLQVDIPTFNIREEPKTKEEIPVKEIKPVKEERPIVKEQIKETIAPITVNQISTQGTGNIKVDNNLKPVTPPNVTIKQEREKEILTALSLNNPRRFSLIFTSPGFKPIALPKIDPKFFEDAEQKPIVREEPKPQPKPKPVTVTPKPGTKPVPKEPEITEMAVRTETEDAKETSVEVYLTNGKGKFYSTTPQVVVTDPATNKAIHKFYRTLNPENLPDQQKIPAGVYNFMLGGNSTRVAKNVTIHPNKINKVVITLSNGSLKFVYRNNPKKQIRGYVAKVTQRGGTADVTQPIEEELSYEPGSYHITVNTTPITHFYVDLDLSTVTEIPIDEPGHVQFTNSDNIKGVGLYTPLGDKYVRFMGIDITGSFDEQKIELKPGPYQARYTRNPNSAGAKETIVPFVVESNTVTELELK